MTPAEQHSIREWMFDRITLIADNNDQVWRNRLTRAARPGEDNRAKGQAVVDELRELISRESYGTARTLLFEVLDLADSRQAEMLGAHFGEAE